MFELIRANKRRSMVLVFVMLGLLLVLGFGIGSALVPSIGHTQFSDGEVKPRFAFDPTGGFIGLGVAFCIWMVQSLVAYYRGDKILLSVSGARQIEKSDHPQLFNIVEEMCIASALPKMPAVYIIDDPSPNAFATGRKPENAAVAVTTGLLAKLNRDELQGVIAHEISHIVHRDVLFMTMVGIMLGTIVMMSEIFLRSLWYGAGSRRFSGGKKGGGGQVIVMVLVVVLAIAAPILAQLIYFAASRRREYLADAGAAVYTRYPEGLASALEAISSDTHRLVKANRATAPMYIINPLHKAGAMALNMTSTHPPIDERIRILRSMAGGVSYAKYQEAWKASGGKAAIPASALAEEERPMREADPASKSNRESRKQMRDAGDALRRVNEFLFLPCACGMRLKLPPDFKRESVDCPRCRAHLTVPVAQLAAIGAVTEQLGGTGTGAIPMAVAENQEELTVKRQGNGWQSFRCRCGRAMHLSPSFSGEKMQCQQCGRTTRVL